MIPRQFVEVVLADADGRFHYHLPPPLEEKRLEPGMRLLVPFGKGCKVAYFVRPVAQPDVPKTRAILALLDEASLLSPSLFKLLVWMSGYYFSPLGGVMKGALPQGIDAVARRRFHFTRPEGRGREVKSPLQEKLIALLREEGSLTEPQLRKKWMVSETPAEPASPAASDAEIKKKIRGALSALKKKGWIEEGWEVERPRVRPKYRKLVSLNAERDADGLLSSLEKRAPQQANVLKTLLSAGGSLPLAAFEAPLRAPLRRLIQKRWVEESETVASRSPKQEAGFRIKGPVVLNGAQQAAADQVAAALQQGTFAPFLLHGVTGSGKTEVYLNLIEEALRLGKGAILLVPEIGLTAQLVARFHRRFGEAVALFHSGLSPGERYDEWCRIKEGKALLAIGVRSAIFAPIERLGLIIVDEEQESSYKQEERMRYHARDLAMVRGRGSGAVVLLGSATPSFESFYNSRTGKYRYLSLPGRVDARPLPGVGIVDLKEKARWVRPFLTEPLLAAIEKRLVAKEQTMLFINRRGFSPSLFCSDCGHFPQCVRCSVSLPFHKEMKKLLCHYCGFQSAPPLHCPDCQGVRLAYLGVGTEQVEEEIRRLFPEARLARMDRDTTQKKEAHQKILVAMDQEEIDILIGTQMIAKGHDFPKVTLVGVLCADLSLFAPDFRSSERTFQLLTQVAGRAGRGDLPGEVMIQTFQPGHESIAAATTHDYAGFYEREIAFRKESGYPPFCRLTLLLFSHRNESTVADRAEAFAALVRSAAIRERLEKEVHLLGPAPAPLLRLRGAYRYQVLLKGVEQRKIAAVLQPALAGWKKLEQKGVALEVNVDPQNFS